MDKGQEKEGLQSEFTELANRIDKIIKKRKPFKGAEKSIEQWIHYASSNISVEEVQENFDRMFDNIGGDIAFRREGKSYPLVTLGVCYSEEGKLEEFTDIPEGMEYPIYSFDIDEEEIVLVTSPYGIQPQEIIGSNNKLYSIWNEYYLDKKGHGVKFEGIMSLTEEGETLEESIRWKRMGKWEIKRVNFIPSKQDSRYVTIDPGDIEKIGHYLNLIESGEFVQVR